MAEEAVWAGEIVIRFDEAMEAQDPETKEHTFLFRAANALVAVVTEYKIERDAAIARAEAAEKVLSRRRKSSKGFIRLKERNRAYKRK